MSYQESLQLLAERQFGSSDPHAGQDAIFSASPEREHRYFHIGDYIYENGDNVLALLEDWAEKVFAGEETIPVKMWKHIEQLVSDCGGEYYVDFLQLAIEEYSFIESSCMQQLNYYSSQRNQSGKELFRQQRKVVIKERKLQCKALQSMLRHVMHRLSPVRRGAVMLYAVQKRRQNLTNQTIMFPRDVFEEEIALFLADYYRRDESFPQLSVTQLAACSFPNGALVTFEDSIGYIDSEGHDGVAFLHNHDEIPDGEYLIHREGRRTYACRRLTDYVEQEIKDDERMLLLLVEPVIASQTYLPRLIRRLTGARQISLELPKPQSGAPEGTLLLQADGCTVGYVHSSVRVNGMVHQRQLQEELAGMTGMLKSCRRLSRHIDGGEDMDTALIVLTDVYGKHDIVSLDSRQERSYGAGMAGVHKAGYTDFWQFIQDEHWRNRNKRRHDLYFTRQHS